MKKLIGQHFLLIITFLISFNQGQAQNYFSQNTTTGLPTSVFTFDIKDLENDGDLDFVISDFTNVNIYTNDGSGNFTLLSGTAFSSVTYDFANVKFIDIDGDNDQDVLIVSSVFNGSSASQLYRNDGGNTFTLMNNFPAVDMYSTAITVGDFHNDNDNDIIITGIQTSGSVFTYSPFFNDGNGNFSATLNVSNLSLFRWSNGSNQFPFIVDLNGDNLNDYVVANGSQSLRTSINGNILINNSLIVNDNAAVADFDGDGDNDIFANLGETNYLLFNGGASNFTEGSQTFAAGKGVGLMAIGDVDNDGDIDILRKGKSTAGSAYIGGLYINDAKGYFYQNTAVSFPDIEEGQSMFADLNGDGYPELIVCDQFTNAFYYYNNTFTTNHPDQALDLDGTNYYTTNHEAALNTLPMTVEFWVHGANYASIGLMQKVTGVDGLQIGLIGGSLYVDYRMTNSNTFVLNQVYNVADGNWHHIAIVIESTGAKLYGNGIERGTASWTGTPTAMTNTAGFELGRWTLNSDVFAGSFDEVRIWNTARTQTEIVNNMCGKISNPTSDANLVAYYSMDDYISGNNVLLDESSKHNTLTISGGSQTLVAEQVGCTAPALPVEFISFTGTLENDNVILKWVTATEENNEGFEIERSLSAEQAGHDGLNWDNIGFVQGNGTTTEISEYQFNDGNLRNAESSLYYRLKQIDYDGNYEYSNIINLTPDSYRDKQFNNQTINLFPNPVSDILNIEINQPTVIQITNTIGQVVQEQTINSSTTLSLKDLTAGIYFIKIGNQTQKIIKE